MKSYLIPGYSKCRIVARNRRPNATGFIVERVISFARTGRFCTFSLCFFNERCTFYKVTCTLLKCAFLWLMTNANVHSRGIEHKHQHNGFLEPLCSPLVPPLAPGNHWPSLCHGELILPSWEFPRNGLICVFCILSLSMLLLKEIQEVSVVHKIWWLTGPPGWHSG